MCFKKSLNEEQTFLLLTLLKIFSLFRSCREIIYFVKKPSSNPRISNGLSLTAGSPAFIRFWCHLVHSTISKCFNVKYILWHSSPKSHPMFLGAYSNHDYRGIGLKFLYFSNCHISYHRQMFLTRKVNYLIFI